MEDRRAVRCPGIALVDIELAEPSEKRSMKVDNSIMDDPAGGVARQLGAAGCGDNKCRRLIRRQVMEVEPGPDRGAKVQADHAAQRVLVGRRNC